MIGYHNGIQFETIMDYHNCTAEELDKFAPSTADSVNMMKWYKDGNGTLLCIDWERYGDNLKIWGNS